MNEHGINEVMGSVARFCMTLGLAGACLGSAQAAAKVRVTEALEWLYPDSKVEDLRACSETDVPVNGVAEANVLFNGLTAGVPLRLSADCADAEWFRLLDVPVPVNTGLDGEIETPGVTNVFVTRDAPFRVYDAMEPIADGAFVPSAPTAALRFRLRRFGVSSGSQTVRFSFSQGGETATRSFTINVHPVRVPPVGRKSFKYTNWMYYKQMAESHGLAEWSPEHMRMIEKYVELAVYGRQNTAMLPPFWEEKRLADFAKMLDRAGIAYFEGRHLATFSTGRWGAPAFTLYGSTNLTTSAKGAAEVAEKASFIYGVLDKYGWKDRWYQHIADEPSHHNADEYVKTCGIVRKYMPGIRLMDALEAKGIVGVLDGYCPKNQYYEENRSHFDGLRTRPTDEIWCYTCMTPGGKWMNRVLDHELMRPLLIPWGCRRFGLDGYLHWGYNWFLPKTDPLKGGMTLAQYQAEKVPPGDCNLIYAGKDGPLASVRLEAMRQGFEDCDLLRVLSERDKAAADRLVARLVRGFADYTTDVGEYRKVRRTLLKALAR